MACYTFGKLEIKTLTSNGFKNQTNDIFKLLGHNCSYQQGLVQQKIVSLHCCGFNLKFTNVTVFTENWGNIKSCVYVSTVALLPSFSIKKK